MKPLKRFVALDKTAHVRETFCCSNPPLNTFLQKQAAKHYELGISATYVLPAAGVAKGELKPIVSYYTLTTDTISRTTLPEKLAKTLPYYPVPVMVIARLAVDESCTGQGLGGITLIRAIRHCVTLSNSVPSYAIVVDAKDEEAQSFYLQYGFLPLEVSVQKQTRLFIPMKVAEQV